MTRKIVSLIFILLLTGGLRAASGTDDAELRAGSQSGWVEGTRPVHAEPSIGSDRLMAGLWWRTSGDAGTIPGTHFLGTTDNKAFEIKVWGNRALRVEPGGAVGTPCIIGGNFSNSIDPGSHGSIICGGGSASLPNQIKLGADYVMLGGGIGNVIDSSYGVICGGYENYSSLAGTICGGCRNIANGAYSFIGGGAYNKVESYESSVVGGYRNEANATYAFVGGGSYPNATDNNSSVVGGTDNEATEYAAFVGGGNQCVASEYCATVPGGYKNHAAGYFSFAAGRQAKANHGGSFVWGDNSAADVASTANNQFLARASGGVCFYTNSALTTGAFLAAGSGSWSSVSDKNVKENFSSVDGAEILASLADVPITTWNYKSQDKEIRHIGPMAQDFHAAFGVGDDSRHLTTVDVDGIALASIQALYQENLEKDAEIDQLKSQLSHLEARLEQLEKEE